MKRRPRRELIKKTTLKITVLREQYCFVKKLDKCLYITYQSCCKIPYIQLLDSEFSFQVKDTQVLAATAQPNMLGRLNESNQLLEEIQKGLNAYLEKKQLFFPR